MGKGRGARPVPIYFGLSSVIILDKDRSRPAKRCIQKVDKHPRNLHKLKFSLKMLAFYVLAMCSKP